jgi:hypothetical protein
MALGVLPPTRIISWQQVTQDADQDWNRQKQRPWIYQFSTGRRFLWRPDIYTAPADGSPAPAPGPSPITQDNAIYNDGGVAYMLNPWEFPTAPGGLLPGQIWYDGGVLAIMPGYIYDVSQPSLHLGVPSYQVLLAGAVSMPFANPRRHDFRFWNNGGLVCIDV